MGNGGSGGGVAAAGVARAEGRSEYATVEGRAGPWGGGYELGGRVRVQSSGPASFGLGPWRDSGGFGDPLVYGAPAPVVPAHPPRQPVQKRNAPPLTQVHHSRSAFRRAKSVHACELSVACNEHTPAPRDDPSLVRPATFIHARSMTRDSFGRRPKPASTAGPVYRSRQNASLTCLGHRCPLPRGPLTTYPAFEPVIAPIWRCPKFWFGCNHALGRRPLRCDEPADCWSGPPWFPGRLGWANNPEKSQVKPCGPLAN